MAEADSVRRWYLLKAQYNVARDELGLAAVWWAKQEATAGTALPTSFPARVALAAAHYTTLEDLTGSDVDELVSQGLSRADAAAAVAALAP